MGNSTGGAPARGAPPPQAAEYLRILVTLSRRLAESALDLDVVLDAVAGHVVEALGDGCAVFLIAQNGVWLEAVTIRHREPAHRAVMEEINRIRKLRVGEGFAGKVIGTGEPIALFHADPATLRSTVVPEFIPYLERVGVSSLLVVPLAGKGRVHGALWLSRDPGSPPYTEMDLELVEAIADCASLALDSTVLHAQYNADRQRLAASAARTAKLQEVTAALSGAATPEEVADVVARIAVGSMGGVAGSLMLPNEARSHLEIASHVGHASYLLKRFQMLSVIAHNPVARAFREGTDFYFEDLERYGLAYPTLRDVAVTAGYEAAAALPLRMHGEVLGVLWVRFATRREFDADERKLMSTMVAQAAQALERSRLYTRARKTVALRDEFLSVAAHELRTPLAAMKLQIQSLQRELDRLPPDEERTPRLHSKAALVDRQIRRLEQLVTDLLDLSRLTSGKLQLRIEEFDLVELVHEIRDRMTEEVARAGGRLTLHAVGPLRGQWDRARLDQVLSNLMSNAIKYGGGRPITLTAMAEGSEVRLAVHDQGIGISQEDQARIFERFERAVPGRNYSGFGVGLWICKQSVEALGGIIRVQSQPGQGSTFEVLLPYKART